MPKFPDPTKIYEAEPVAGAIDATTLPPQEPVAPPPPTPPAPEPVPVAPPSTISHEPSTITPSSSPFRNLIPIIIGVVSLLVLGVLAFTILPKFFKKAEPVTLTYWGLWEPSSAMQGVIADYETQNPNVKISYSMQSPKNYRTRALSAEGGAGSPDIIRIHNTWLPMMKSTLAPAPESVVTTADLADFYPVVQKDLVAGGEIYALPIEIDGLVLYYNTKMLEELNATPPTDWNALRKLAFDLTRRNPETQIIERAGVALGTAENIDHWSDILGLLILQNSGSPGKPSDTAVQDALTFYTIFSTQDKSWDQTQPNSIYAFATGTVAMILAPAWQASEIAAINPELEFGTAPAPTLPSADVAWATYWAEAVPATSKNREEAWKFIKFLTSPEAQQKIFAGASQIRAVGEPYSRLSLGASLSTHPVLAPVIAQGGKYTSWYLADRTYDDGLNDQLLQYYKDAVNAINTGSTVGSIIKTLDEGVAQVLSRYPEAK